MDDLKIGALLARTEPKASPLPLERTDVMGTVTGPVAAITVQQTFSNPFDNPVNLEYLFPLSERAAIVDYTITIGARSIKADLKEREAARRTYDQAVSAGKRASLLEQQRPNLFTIEIGNVQPGDRIVTTVFYEERLRYRDGRYEFVFPMGITPRYHDVAHGSPTEGANVDRPFVAPDQLVGQASISLDIDAGLTIESPSSRTHEATMINADTSNSFAAQVKTQPNKDFVLSWGVARDHVRAAAWSSQDADAETHIITVLPPRLDLDADPDPREFIFVIDRSGSMGNGSGSPMEQAKNALRACIRALNTDDAFTVLAFDTAMEWFSQRTQSVTQANIDAADRWIDALGGRGGTDIVRAVKDALALKQDANRTRYVVFLTDGSVSADDKTINTMLAERADARVFTFGIGPSVNRYLLTKMADLGRGVAEYLGASDDIEGALIRFQDRVSYPALLDLSLAFDNASEWDTYPDPLPDLYVGEPLQVVTRMARTGDAVATVQGTRGDDSVTLRVPLPKPESENVALKRLWARERVEYLLDSARNTNQGEQTRTQVISLALAYRLVTPYTSFVAVDSEVVENTEDTEQVVVSGALPEGLNPAPFGAGSMTLAGMAPPMSPSPRSARRLGRGPTPERKQGLVNRLVDSFKGLGGPSDEDQMTSGGSGADAPIEEERARGISLDGPTIDYMMMESGTALKPEPEPVDPKQPLEIDKDDYLKQLARTQNVDGSWNADGTVTAIEVTAAALLAFVRAGHTAREGDYRAQLRKTYRWLKNANTSGLDEIAVYAVTRALAEHDGEALPDAPFGAPETVASLNDLRKLALLRGGVTVPYEIVSTLGQSNVVRWAAL
ncbi:MAG: VIT domain-containing protein [Chloroflexota bacterium]